MILHGFSMSKSTPHDNRPTTETAFIAKKDGKWSKIVLVAGKDPTPEEQEAAIENAWRVSGDLRIIACRLGMCRTRNEPPPAWVHNALRELADTSRPTAETERYQRDAVRLVRYVAVRDAHDREGLSWEKAKERAAEKLRGAPAEAEADMMWTDYKSVRKALRAAGLADDDPGYRWCDTPTA